MKSKFLPKKLKRGAFTEQAKRHGMSVAAFARHVLAHPDQFSDTTVRRARLAKTFRKWANARKK